MPRRLPRRLRRVEHAAPSIDQATWTLWLACGHQTQRRVVERRPAPARVHCETCGSGPVLLPGQLTIDDELGVDVSDLPPF